MAQMKRWESPRRSGRNDKGRGGSARAKQLKKRQRQLLKRLRGSETADNIDNARGEASLSLLF